MPSLSPLREIPARTRRFKSETEKHRNDRLPLKSADRSRPGDSNLALPMVAKSPEPPPPDKVNPLPDEPEPDNESSSVL